MTSPDLGLATFQASAYIRGGRNRSRFETNAYGKLLVEFACGTGLDRFSRVQDQNWLNTGTAGG